MQDKKADNVRIGIQIKRAREAAGLTQEKFAERISLAAKNVSAIERGAAGFSVPVLMRICDVLGVSSDTLLFGDPADSQSSNTASNLVCRLDKLTPEQLEIAKAIINKLFEAFATASE
ncbi:MAG: helix-turn-helix transcriptional regulator [Oscillospiraceae bacterium]|nr:helix-turn-helix transcriptional regulator [Oscillospiraceae bacterium]